MSKHTPGPWGALKSNRSNLVHVETGEGSPAGQGVPVATMTHGTIAVRLANACLMSASPDMLDALKAFLAEADSWHDSTHPEGQANAGIRCDGICACRAAARAAIAKAEGR